jgi:hypothetical protein
VNPPRALRQRQSADPPERQLQQPQPDLPAPPAQEQPQQVQEEQQPPQDVLPRQVLPHAKSLAQVPSQGERAHSAQQRDRSRTTLGYRALRITSTSLAQHHDSTVHRGVECPSHRMMCGGSYPPEVKTWGEALWHSRTDLWLTKLLRGEAIDSEQLKLFLDWALPERRRTTDPPRTVLRAAFRGDEIARTWKDALQLPKTAWWLSQDSNFVKATELFAFLDWARAQRVAPAPVASAVAVAAAAAAAATACAGAADEKAQSLAVCVICLDAPATHSFVHGDTAHQAISCLFPGQGVSQGGTLQLSFFKGH